MLMLLMLSDGSPSCTVVNDIINISLTIVIVVLDICHHFSTIRDVVVFHIYQYQ